MAALFDYLRCYYHNHFRPPLAAEKTSYQFAYKESTSAQPRCLACGFIVPPKRAAKYLDHHIRHTDKQHISKCDGLTRYLRRQVDALVLTASKTDSVKSNKRKYVTDEFGKRKKQSKVDDESTSLGRLISGHSVQGIAFSAVQAELSQDLPEDVIGRVFSKNCDLHKYLLDLKKPDLASAISKVCKEQLDLIFVLQRLYLSVSNGYNVSTERSVQTGEEDHRNCPIYQCLCYRIPHKGIRICRFDSQAKKCLYESSLCWISRCPF